MGVGVDGGLEAASLDFSQEEGGVKYANAGVLEVCCCFPEFLNSLAGLIDWTRL